MADIIKHKELLTASTNSHDGFCVGDYITDRRNECFYRIDSKKTKSFGEGREVVFFVCVGINPITLQLDGGDRELSENELCNYFHVLNVDATKTRDIAHKIMFEGAQVEEFEESGENTLMTLGNKQSLISLRESIERSRRMVSQTNEYCNLIRSQLMHDIQKKLDGVNAIVKKMTREISKLNYVIQTIETYAGIKEEIVTIKSGERAGENTPIVIRQAVVFMDEEIALVDDDFDWQKIEKFDKWLVENDNFKTMLPDEKSVIAIKPRRTDKEYAKNDSWYNFVMNQPNHLTLFLIRNGENLYRLESEHISLDDRMFPNVNEYAKVIEEESKVIWRSNEEDKKSDRMRRRYTKIAFLLQGLLDRSDVFSPHNVQCSFLKYEGIDNKTIVMRYELDESRLLTDGRPTVWDWIKQLNNKLEEGKRIVLVTSGRWDTYKYGYGFSEKNFIRYYSSEYSQPDFPNDGVYSLKNNPIYKEDDGFGYTRTKQPYCFSYLPDNDAYSWTEGFTKRKNKVSIVVDVHKNGVLNYDDLNLEELEYYLNSRLYRSQYYLYVRLLKAAKQIVLYERKQEQDFISMLAGQCICEGLEPKDGKDLHDIIGIALQTIKDRLKWKRPISSKEKETYTLVKRTLFSKAFVSKYFKANK